MQTVGHGDALAFEPARTARRSDLALGVVEPDELLAVGVGDSKRLAVGLPHVRKGEDEVGVADDRAAAAHREYVAGLMRGPRRGLSGVVDEVEGAIGAHADLAQRHHHLLDLLVDIFGYGVELHERIEHEKLDPCFAQKLR